MDKSNLENKFSSSDWKDKNAMSDEIVVKVSGAAVYKAVQNYLNNNQDLKDMITAHVISSMNTGNLDTIVQKEVERTLKLNYQATDAIRKAVKSILDAKVKAEIDDQVKESLKQALDNAVFIMPKLPKA